MEDTSKIGIRAPVCHVYSSDDPNEARELALLIENNRKAGFRRVHEAVNGRFVPGTLQANHPQVKALKSKVEGEGYLTVASPEDEGEGYLNVATEDERAHDSDELSDYDPNAGRADQDEFAGLSNLLNTVADTKSMLQRIEQIKYTHPNNLACKHFQRGYYDSLDPTMQPGPCLLPRHAIRVSRCTFIQRACHAKSWPHAQCLGRTYCGVHGARACL